MAPPRAADGLPAHKGVIAGFGAHFVKPGIFPAAMGRGCRSDASDDAARTDRARLLRAPGMRAALLALAAMLLAGCSAPADEADAEPDAPVAAPPPPPEEGSVHVEVGDTWRYAGRDGSTTNVTVLSKENGTIRIRSTTTKAGNSTAVTSAFDERTFALVLLHDPRFGLTIPFDPPIPILVPARDHEHRGNLSIATILGELRQPVAARVVYYGLENLTVPAGNFTSYHYAVEISSQGAYRFRETRHLWFAPEVHQAALMLSDGRTDELVAYDPAPRPQGGPFATR